MAAPLYRQGARLAEAQEVFTSAQADKVADQLEIKPNSARQRYGRALRRLHQQLAANGIDLDGNVQ